MRNCSNLIGLIALVCTTMTSMATGQCNPRCKNIAVEQVMVAEIQFAPGAYTLTDSECVAMVIAYSTEPCQGYFNPMTGFPFDNDETHAYAYSHQDIGPGMIYSDAESAVFSGSDRIGLYTRTLGEVLQSCCFGVVCKTPAGAWLAYAVAWTDVSGSGPFTVSIGSTLSFRETPLPSSIRRSALIGYFGGGTPYPSVDVISVWAIDNKLMLNGYTYDSTNDQYDGVLVASGSDIEFLRTIDVVFDDAQMDVDGDERFNDADVVKLQTEIGSTSSDLVPKFDFDGSGAINQADVDALGDLVAVGLDSGVLGDYDGNGNADCADLAAMGVSWDYELGDANYLIELDADLDGDNDAVDYDAVYDILQPADINDDGLVNSQDMVAYLALFAALDPAADLNGDGIVNTQDFVLFLNLWNNPC